jgi:hypothetical protein
MDQMDVRIRGGIVIAVEGITLADMAIQGGVIVAVASMSMPHSTQQLDATGLHVSGTK